MKKYKINFIILIAVFSGVISSCTEGYEEVNTNTNEPETVSDPGLLLMPIIRDLANDNYRESVSKANIMGDYTERQFISMFQFPAADEPFWDFYGYIRGLHEIIVISQKGGKNRYEGIALVLRSFMFQKLTDLYGNIPYSEAVSAIGGINYPKYDTQQEVYNGILADLKEANLLLSSTNEPISGDILFNGDIMKWRKFANALSMRCLMRISGVQDPSVAMSEIVDNPAQYPLFQSHSDQAALQYIDELGNEFPGYRDRAGDYTKHITENFLAHLVSLNDPRKEVYAQPTAASVAGGGTLEYVGVPNGIMNEKDFNGSEQNQSLLGLLWTPRSEYEVIASPTAAQSLLMTNSELQFILAEAAEKGYISGNAEAYYLAGIEDQFDYFSSRIPAYYTLPTASSVMPTASYYTQAGVAYTGTQSELLNKIWIQKWFSLYGNSYEGWSHWRRTGVPSISAGVTSDGYVPVRMIYPSSERSANPDQLDLAISAQGSDADNTRLWWDVN